jgi:hypothetical protein
MRAISVLHLPQRWTKSLSHSRQKGSQNSGQNSQHSPKQASQAQQPLSRRTRVGPVAPQEGHSCRRGALLSRVMMAAGGGALTVTIMGGGAPGVLRPRGGGQG